MAKLFSYQCDCCGCISSYAKSQSKAKSIAIMDGWLCEIDSLGHFCPMCYHAPRSILSKRLDDLNLSKKSRTILNSLSAKKLSDIATMTQSEIFRCDGAGRKTGNEILLLLKSYGLDHGLDKSFVERVLQE